MIVRRVDEDRLETVLHTCDMVLGHVKASLDYNLAGLNMFQANLVECRLVTEVIIPVLKIFQVQASELQLTIKSETQEMVSPDPKVKIDKLRVQQIIINLV